MNYTTADALFFAVIGCYVDVWPTVGKRLEEHGPGYSSDPERTALCRCSSSRAEVAWPCPEFSTRLAEAEALRASRFKEARA